MLEADLSPYTGSENKFLQDIAFGYLSSGTAGVSCRPVGFSRADRKQDWAQMEQVSPRVLESKRACCLVSQKQEPAMERTKSGHVPEMGFESERDMRNIWEVLGGG